MKAEAQEVTLAKREKTEKEKGKTSKREEIAAGKHIKTADGGDKDERVSPASTKKSKSKSQKESASGQITSGDALSIIRSDVRCNIPSLMQEYVLSLGVPVYEKGVKTRGRENLLSREGVAPNDHRLTVLPLIAVPRPQLETVKDCFIGLQYPDGPSAES